MRAESGADLSRLRLSIPKSYLFLRELYYVIPVESRVITIDALAAKTKRERIVMFCVNNESFEGD